MRIKLALSAVSVAAVSVVGVSGPFHGDAGPVLLGPMFDSDGGHSVVHNPELARVVDLAVSPAAQRETDVAATSTLGDFPNADGSQPEANDLGGSVDGRLRANRGQDGTPHGGRSAPRQLPHNGNGGCGSDCRGQGEPAASADRTVGAEAAGSDDGGSDNGQGVARQPTIRRAVVGHP
jgi:hypothetical protein